MSRTFQHIIGKNQLLAALVALLSLFVANADEFDIQYEGGVTINAGSGDFAPYYMASNRAGTLTQKFSTLLNAGFKHDMDSTKRFSYAFGAEFWGGFASSTTYERYNTATKQLEGTNKQHPANAWVQQLYADVKYRCLFATIGQKTKYSPLVNNELSSGDLIMSGNARAGAGVQVGILDYQDIPFTKGWVQVKGQLGYEKFGDSKWLENHYNYYDAFVTTGSCFHYKNIYFRTNPEKRFVATIGAQASCQFAGTQYLYEDGVLTNIVKMPANLKAFFRCIIAGSGGNNAGDVFVEGNHVGSWDVSLDYKLRGGGKIRGYFQKPWEDGSGIGFQNGFDGLWGLEWQSGKRGIVSDAVLEYVDLTNQSGPIHYAPTDHPDYPLPTKGATGMDDYYNNYAYNGYQNRGMSVGSPFVKSTLYNTDGYLRYTDNLMRGFHMAVKGYVSPEVSYRAMFSYRTSWGTTEIPRAHSVHATSFMLESIYNPSWMHGLEMKAQFAFDRGKLYGNTMGGLVSITYHGNFGL